MLGKQWEKWLHGFLNDYRSIIDKFTRAVDSNGVNSSYVGGTICSQVTENFSPGTYCDPYRFTLGEFHLETLCSFFLCVMIRSLYEPADQDSYIHSILLSYSYIGFIGHSLRHHPQERVGLFDQIWFTNFHTNWTKVVEANLVINIIIWKNNLIWELRHYNVLPIVSTRLIRTIVIKQSTNEYYNIVQCI